jgi:hypothetical protein
LGTLATVFIGLLLWELFYFVCDGDDFALSRMFLMPPSCVNVFILCVMVMVGHSRDCFYRLAAV